MELAAGAAGMHLRTHTRVLILYYMFFFPSPCALSVMQINMAACRGELDGDNRQRQGPAGGGRRRRRLCLPRQMPAPEARPRRDPAGGGSKGEEAGGEETRGKEAGRAEAFGRASAAAMLPRLLLPAADGRLR